MHDKDEGTINKIRESLDFLDTNVEVKKPDLMQLVQLVNDVEEKKNSSRNWQFIAFIATAVLIINLELYAFYKSIAFFAVLQAVALICAVPCVILWTKKRNRQVSL